MPAPDARVGGTRLTHLTQAFGRGFVLLDFGGHARHAVIDDVTVVSIVREQDADDTTLVDLHGEAFARYAAADGHAVLVRPDGYVMAQWSAWDATTLRIALRRALPDRPSRRMQPDALDTVYAQLAEAIARVGDARAPLLLATLALDLMAAREDVDQVVAAIARAERLSA